MSLYEILVKSTHQKTRVKCGEMLRLAIAPGGATISQIAEVMQRDQQTTHGFLERLRAKQILERDRVGTTHYYRVSDRYPLEEVAYAIEALGCAPISFESDRFQPSIDSRQQQALDQMLDKLPEFNSEWTPDVMIAYFQSLAAITQAIAKLQEGTP